MKKLINLFTLVVALVSFAACSVEDEERDTNPTVKQNYELFINGGATRTIISQSGESPKIKELYDYYNGLIETVNKEIESKAKFTITAEGNTEEEALENADKKAKDKVAPLKEELEEKIKKLETDFLAKRKALAAGIKVEDSQYRMEMNVGYTLKRGNILEGDREIIFESEDIVILKAEGGQDYSL